MWVCRVSEAEIISEDSVEISSEDRLAAVGVKLKLSKCHFIGIKYLGHVHMPTTGYSH